MEEEVKNAIACLIRFESKVMISVFITLINGHFLLRWLKVNRRVVGYIKHLFGHALPLIEKGTQHTKDKKYPLALGWMLSTDILRTEDFFVQPDFSFKSLNRNINYSIKDMADEKTIKGKLIHRSRNESGINKDRTTTTKENSDIYFIETPPALRVFNCKRANLNFLTGYSRYLGLKSSAQTALLLALLANSVPLFVDLLSVEALNISSNFLYLTCLTLFGLFVSAPYISIAIKALPKVTGDTDLAGKAQPEKS